MCKTQYIDLTWRKNCIQTQKFHQVGSHLPILRGGFHSHEQMLFYKNYSVNIDVKEFGLF